MTPTALPARPPDPCPGLLDLHPGTDGGVARLRIPGGLLDAGTLLAVAGLAETCGGGFVDITSRGNVQLRGVTDPTALDGAASAAGLLPSPAHDRARNVGASPLGDLGALVRELDAGVLAAPALSELTGRFWFALDDGTGGADLASCDVGALRVDGSWRLVLGGRLTVRPGPVQAVLAAAERFVATAPPGVRRVADLPAGALGTPVGAPVAPDRGRLALGPRPGFLVVAARLQRLTATQLRTLAEVLPTGAQARLAAAGRVVLPGVTDGRRPAAAGLLTDDGDPFAGVTACSGLGCVRAGCDVRALAAPLSAGPSHWVGCERRCGLPHDAVAVLPGDDGRTMTVESAYAYEHSGAAIYERSFQIIRAECDLRGVPADLEKVAVRMIHACGLTDLPAHLGWSDGVGTIARAALAAGAPILCDVGMVAQGVTRSRLVGGSEVVCTLQDRRVPALAASLATTRSAAAMELWRDRLEGSVVVIGNAPTALFHLLEMLDAGAPRPAAVLGMPVGFVGAAESKEALATHALGVPHLVVHGRRGGSALASAAVNALATDME